MAPKTESITAVFCEETHRWDDTAILRCEIQEKKTEAPRQSIDMDCDGEIVTVKVYECEPGELESGFPYIFFGRWQEYRRKPSKWDKVNGTPEVEMQFHAKTWRKQKPYDKAGVKKWLKKAPGIGEAVSAKLWELYGPDAIQRVKESPEQTAGEVGSGFTVEKAKMAAAHLLENDSMEAAFVDLAGLFDGRGFPHKLPVKLVRDYGADAAVAVRKNPWLLLQYKSTGVARTDKLYLDLGGNPAAVKRQAIILWHCLLNVTTGSTWVTEAGAAEMLRGRIAGAKIQFQRAVELGVRGKLIATRWDEGMSRWLAEGKRARHEKYIGAKVASMLQEAKVNPCEWPDVNAMDLSDHQRERLAKIFATKCPLIILGGSPGTGKTRTAAQIIKALIASIGIRNIGAGAPTGKAAVRLSEVLDGYGITLRATTEHSMLGVSTSSEKDGWGFRHDEMDPLEFLVILLDEQSMKCVDVMCAVLKAVAKGTRVILLGDANQLPPVGHGRPLFDMIEAGVPYAEFLEVQRNAGSIVQACAAIRDGKPIPWDEALRPYDSPPKNLKIVETRNNAESLEKLVEWLHALKGKTLPVNLRDPSGPKRPIDVVWDAQCLAATNGLRRGKSQISRVEVNKRLQRELNPNGQQVAGSPFRTGDKVMNLSNSWVPIVDEDSPYFDTAANQERNENDACYVANGEIGRVLGQTEKLLFVRLDAPPRVLKVPRGKGDSDSDNGDEEKTNTGCNWDLAYCCTIHKYQGSEIPIILFPMDDSPAARMVMSREALLTAFSRGKWFDVCFGKKAVAESYRKRSALAPRVTFLTDEIKERMNQP